jgi:nicotinate-nucleotide adenylyltransferase
MAGAMKVGLFGGTFDPVHLGHTALARAAQEYFGLQRILFVPAHVPPHKQKRPITAFAHRYAMLVLATANEKAWIPSLLEAPAEAAESGAPKVPPRPSYSIETVRRVRSSLKKGDQLFFLIGMDAFRDIAKWHQAEDLLTESEFIIASRPGYSLADVANALPESLRPAQNVTKPFASQAAKGDLVFRGVSLHLLDSLHNSVAATSVREAVAAGKALGRMLDPAVADYIKKQGLYR